jgi:hypothetical protein
MSPRAEHPAASHHLASHGPGYRAGCPRCALRRGGVAAALALGLLVGGTAPALATTGATTPPPVPATGTAAVGESWAAELALDGGDDSGLVLSDGGVRLAPSTVPGQAAQGVLTLAPHRLAAPTTALGGVLTADLPPGTSVDVQARGLDRHGAWGDWLPILPGTPARFADPTVDVEVRLLLHGAADGSTPVVREVWLTSFGVPQRPTTTKPTTTAPTTTTTTPKPTTTKPEPSRPTRPGPPGPPRPPGPPGPPKPSGPPGPPPGSPGPPTHPTTPNPPTTTTTPPPTTTTTVRPTTTTTTTTTPPPLLSLPPITLPPVAVPQILPAAARVDPTTTTTTTTTTPVVPTTTTPVTPTPTTTTTTPVTPTTTTPVTPTTTTPPGLVPPGLAPPVVKALWDGAIATTGLKGFRDTPYNVTGSSSVTVVDGPQKSIRFTVPSGSQRAEIEPDVPELTEGQTRYFRLTYQLPPSFPTDPSGFQLATQWKNDGDGSPPLELRIEKGQFVLGGGYGRPGGSALFSQTIQPVITGRPVELVVGIHFSSESDTSRVDVWVDGQQKITDFHPPGGTLYPGLSSYWKVGLYRDTSDSGTATADLTAASMGTSYDSVR